VSAAGGDGLVGGVPVREGGRRHFVKHLAGPGVGGGERRAEAS
jgi:hypothetical protein